MPGEYTEEQAVPGCAFSVSKEHLKELEVVTCQAGLGWLAEGFTTNPSLGQ